MEIFLKENTNALCIFVSLYMQKALSDCPDVSGCQEDILEGPDSAENIVNRNPVHLGGPAGLMQTGARCWLSTVALRQEGKHSPNET